MPDETNEPVFLTREIVDKIHERSIASYGGLLGVLNEHLLESAINQPRHITAAVIYLRLLPLTPFTLSQTIRTGRATSVLGLDQHLYFLN